MHEMIHPSSQPSLLNHIVYQWIGVRFPHRLCQVWHLNSLHLNCVQFVFWIIVPSIIAKGDKVSTLLGVIIFLFCLQYIPKVFHIVLVIQRMQRVTGYIFGTAWWGFALNLIAYFIASHVRLANDAT